MFMKNTSKLNRVLLASLITLATASLVSPVRAEEPAKKEKKVSKKVLEKYDLNHNGVLEPEEEAAWKADQEKARAERKKKHEEDASAKQDDEKSG